MKHILHKYDFDTILVELFKRVDLGLVEMKMQGDLALFNYSKDCQFSKSWDDFTLSARGLILDLSAQKIVALPFPKFFNYSERAESLPDESFEVFNKYDGSLGICYFHNGKWSIATRGSFDSDQAKWATDFLQNHINEFTLSPRYTYLFEIIYPSNKIVIDYKGWSGLVFLGSYLNETFEEANFDRIYTFCFDTIDESPIKCAEVLHYPSIDRMLEVCKTMTHNKEGFVVRFANGHRIKIKGDAYCRIHKLISNITPIGVWESLKNGDNEELILKDLPEEFHKDWNSMKRLLQKQRSDIQHHAFQLQSQYLTDKNRVILNEREARKNYALWVKSVDAPHIVKQLLLAPSERWDYITYRYIRPDGNKLDGYVSSNSMNRFEDE